MQEIKPIYITDPIDRLLDMLAEEMVKTVIEEVEQEQKQSTQI